MSWLFAAIVIATSVAIASGLPDPKAASTAPDIGWLERTTRSDESRPLTLPSASVKAGERLAFGIQSLGDLPPLVQSSDRTHPLRPTPPYSNADGGHLEIRQTTANGRIERSIFEAAQAAGLPEHLISQLAEIFAWDIDMARDVQEGDTFAVIYEQRYWLGRRVNAGPILAAEFVNQGRVYRAIGFRDENGTIDYYSPDGRSLRRPFLRAPVRFTRVSSYFSNARYHPVLKLRRAHTGVDYAAPEGAPVRATADGRISLLGWNGGYGKTIVIDHGNGYSTLYAHLSRFRPQLSAGTRVRQGETIGYVGRTGLTNGAHLHYEFRVSGRHQNPLTYEFPAGEILPAHRRGDFRRIAAELTARMRSVTEHRLAAIR